MQPLLLWKSKEYYTTCVWICSLRWPACSAHAPYFHLWPAPLYNIFPNYFLNCTIFFLKLLNMKCVSRFSTKIVWNIFYSEKNWARYDRKCTLVIMQSTIYSSPFLMKLEFSWQIFKKYPNIKFHENPSSGHRVVPCGQTDRRTEGERLIVASRNFANAPKNWLWYVLLSFAKTTD